jgi:DNA repair protein RecN (Recombination protein N)
MLEELQIRNFALIESLTVTFTKGLNILTGETGAGKSILIDALNAVLAGKVAPQAVRVGAERACIEATFKQTAEVASWLKEQELADEEGDRLTISREISKSGSRLRINGTLVNAAAVTDLRQKLLSMHAQHEARTLASPQAQLEMLDRLGDAAHKKLKEKVRTLYARKRDLSSQLSAIEISEEERLRTLDFARFQLGELEDACLSGPKEDEQIAAELAILENVAELETLSSEAQVALAGGELQSACVIDLIQEALAKIEQAQLLDPSLAGLHDSLADCAETVEQAARSLRRYKEGLEGDPENLAKLQERLACLAQIKRKYGPGLDDAIGRQKSLSAEVERLSGARETADKLAEELSQVEEQLKKLCRELSSARASLCKKLAGEVGSVLAELGMERSRFEISIEEVETGPSGADRIEFLISPNPGQPLLPVSKIASGGELSRVMLAVKSIFSAADRTATVVFDEIDSGCSGRVLQAMRDKLARLAASHQILCITHQPIIASVADNHLLVEKRQTDKTTTIHVAILNEAEKVKSLAKMASGDASGQEALRFAKSLLDEGGRAKLI